MPPRILWIAILNVLFPSLLKFANLRKNWGKEEKKGGGGVRGREIENEPAGMTFNLEPFAYHFSMLKS